MKSHTWRRAVAALIAAGLAVAAFFYFSRPGKITAVPGIDPAFAEYIASYTSGVVTSQSPLTIVLSNDAVDSSLVGSESGERLFEFSPRITGKAVWVDKRTVEFYPDERLAPGQVYRGSFFLSRVASDVPEALGTFEFMFRVVPQNFEVSIVNTRAYDQRDAKRQKIEGQVYTADFATPETLEGAVQATQEGKQLDVSWVHADDGRQHNFTVENVVRSGERGAVDIRVSGKPLGVDRSQEVKVEIPALQEFRLMRTRVVQSPSQYVALQFSDPVSADQNLRGLIRIGELTSLDFDIHDNEIRVYPPVRQVGTMTLRVTDVRNISGRKLVAAVSEEIVFEQVKPAVRFTGKGSILPGTDGLVVPFEAVSLNAVDVQITRIHEDNVLQFLQVNNLETGNELRRVGNRVLRKRISLTGTGVADPGKWNRYTLELSKLIQAEPGAIYEVKLSFRKGYSTYACEHADQADEADQVVIGDSEELPDDDFNGAWSYDYYDDYYYGDDFDWRQRENPCHNSYYTSDRSVSRNVLASDLGLIVKRGEDGKALVWVTDLRTTEPLAGVAVTLYSYQLQALASGTTDKDGRIALDTRQTPFSVVARKGSQRGYMRMVNGEALMVSSFDVSGQVVQKGLKGFLYGERGVWRPGDSLFLSFILEDRQKTLPANHPVVFELSDPHGVVAQRMVRSTSENGFYRFATATAPDAPTGNWLARVKVGGTDFTQTLKIETVKPNRLKIDLDFGADRFTSPEIEGTLDVRWLHGAPGRNLRAEYDVLLVREPTRFPAFSGFNFDDPSREFESESQPFFEGTTDANGRAEVKSHLELSGTPSGVLNAIFRGKVFEESGNFSVDRFVVPFYPYKSFVGMRVPEGERYTGILYTDTPHTIEVATVDAAGKAVSREDVEMNLFKLDWRWWWDQSSERLANFVEGSYSRLVKSGKVNTINGKGQWTFNLEAAEYGRYFLRACDPVSGHCSGQVIFVDEPGWYSRARAQDARGGANLLSFSTDKESYNIGETIHLTIPGAADGRALVSLENGSKVLQTYWVKTTAGENRFSFEATAGMAPNVYVHVSLLQPHAQTVNDMPIRLYGVKGVQVEDPATHLEPEISMPDVLRPEEPVVIRVSEKSGRKMTYTLAVVDEGLLDLTRFRTPDAWKSFYAREALGVRTWDVFDHVLGAFGTSLERYISIGGDQALSPGEVDPLANRFRPVVKFFGPFTLDGGEDKIQFTMPRYIGAVKTMLVAGNAGAYGMAEKVSTVKNPLMVLATLPRVLGPNERVRLPVTLFTGEQNLPSVGVTVTTQGPVSVSGEDKKSLSLAAGADETIDFALAVKNGTGTATVTVTATSGNLRSTDVIEVGVRNPNPPENRVQEYILEEGKTVSATITPFGLAGTNSAVMEISAIPAINLSSRMRYLLQYPHGCLEQTTSAAFPQLFIDRVRVLTDAEKGVVQHNVKAAIEQMKSFVQADGGFGYWPGVSESSDAWSTSYAGHFLLEAGTRGYYVPADMLQRWKRYQRTKTAEWRRNRNFPNSDLTQSYRLYTLALAGSAEFGAMNRLREDGNLTPAAAWMLASAFAAAGRPEAARKLIDNLPQTVKPYRELGYTYGSALRDKAFILETLVTLNETERAFEVLKEIAAALGNEGHWMSTQETAMCLKAVSAFVSHHKRGDLNLSYRAGSGKRVDISTGLPVAEVEVPVTDNRPVNLEMKNNSSGILFARLIATGTPARGEEEDAAKELYMEVAFTDTEGRPVDPSTLEQGSQFVAEVSVSHPGVRGRYENLALSQVFPSGWEINNLRFEGAEEALHNSAFQYQDIRDDRVLTYFDLNPSEKKTFRVLLTASYAGDYYLPAVSCEAMYDGTVYARKKGREVSVVKASTR